MSSNTAKENRKKIEKDLIGDLQKLSEQTKNGVCSRDYYRRNGKFTEQVWSQVFGTFPQFQRAAGLKQTRMQQKLLNKLAVQDDIDLYRKYYESEVMPWGDRYLNKPSSKRFKSMVVVNDQHDEEMDPFVYGVAVDVAQRLQPDVFVWNGDVFDNYEFSRFDKDIRNCRIGDRFNFVKEKIFSPIRKACPKAELHLIIGNHEYRLMKYLAGRAPEAMEILSDVLGLKLKDIFGLDEFGINLTCKSDLAAISMSDMSNEVKKNYKLFFDNAFACAHEKDLSLGVSGCSGHIHRAHLETFVNVYGRHTWSTVGTCSQYNLHYVQNQDQWMKGMNIVHVDTLTKEVQQQNITIAGDFVEVAGKFYTRKKDT